MRSIRSLALVFGLSAALIPRGGGMIASDPPAAVELWAPSGYLPGVPVLVIVRLRAADGAIDTDIHDGEATLETDRADVVLEPSIVSLRNGLGSAHVLVRTPEPPPDLRLTARSWGLEASRSVRSLAADPVTPVSGDLSAGLTEWSGVVHVTSTVTVPRGGLLRLLPGTVVLVEGVATAEGQPGKCASVASTPATCGPSIAVRGAIESLGTADDPVSITAADPARAWGEVHHDGADPSVYRHTAILRGGNSPRGGHTNTGPSLHATDSRIVFESCAIADGAGKAIAASGSDLVFQDGLMTRLVMGPEIGSTALLLERSWILETRGSDDNDGIYLHSQRQGQTIAIRDCVIGEGDDDGVDTLGSTIAVERTIIRDWVNPEEDAKGISALAGGVDVSRCLIVDTKEAIVAKGHEGAGCVVRVDRTTIDRSGVSLRAQDKYGEPDLKIEILAKDSILLGDRTVMTDYPPSDIQVTYSTITTPWPGTGNLAEDPRLVDRAGNDYHLRPDSPCIDAGDPASDPDPDGTRADMGRYPSTRVAAPAFRRGLVNGDGSLDVSDAVTVLLFLFGGLELDCRDAADIDDDGACGIGDAVLLLRHLFQAGEPPAPPHAACGQDPTADGLPCATAPPCA